MVNLQYRYDRPMLTVGGGGKYTHQTVSLRGVWSVVKPAHAARNDVVPRGVASRAMSVQWVVESSPGRGGEGGVK
jgi:hypothetical protein